MLSYAGGELVLVLDLNLPNVRLEAMVVLIPQFVLDINSIGHDQIR